MSTPSLLWGVLLVVKHTRRKLALSAKRLCVTRVTDSKTNLSVIILTIQIEPEISDVVNEIADVVCWERLGLMLGFSIDDMDMIRSRYVSSEHHQRLAEFWHSRGQEYSWGKLLRELDKMYPRRKSSVSVSSPPPENYGKSQCIVKT